MGNVLFWFIFTIVYNLSVPELNVSAGKRLITPINYCLIFKKLNSTFFRANLCALRTFMTKEKNGAFESCCLVWLKGNNLRIFNRQLWTSTMRKPIDEIKPIWIHRLFFNFVLFVLGYNMYIHLKKIIFSIVEWRRSNTYTILVRNCRYSYCLLLLCDSKSTEAWFLFFYIQLWFTLLF